MLRAIALFAVLVLAAPTLAASEVLPKQIAAPPEQILQGLFDLPDPTDTGTLSAAAMLPIRFEREREVFTARLRVPIDNAASVKLVAFGPGSDRWMIRLRTPGAAEQVLDHRARDRGGLTEQGGVELAGAWRPAATHTLFNRAPGAWDLAIETPDEPRTDTVHGYLFVKSASDIQVYSHLTSHDLRVGRPVGLSTHIGLPNAVRAGAKIVSAELNLSHRSGRREQLAMETNGAFATASFVPISPGDHTAHVIIHGIDANGDLFVRSSQHVFPVVEDNVQLAGHATMKADRPGTRKIILPLSRGQRAERVIVSGEVWASTGNGRSQPVCWLSRMALPERHGVLDAYSLFLDERWLAGVSGELELRNVRVQCCDTAVPLDRLDRSRIDGFVRTDLEPGPITRDMLVGRPRRDLAMPIRESGATPRPRVAGGHNLMLVHGYCAGGNPWPLDDFSGAIEIFADPNQNRSHDEFANLLLSFGNGSKSFGVVAHSQGGAAALHLWTYYFSGLDWAEGPRLIQSVGTPYQGTPLAGNLAILGSLFGQGCGVNSDLSTDGAALWLAGIPPENRASVSYWTTAPTSGSCNFLSGLFLSNPEDGVVESVRGQLPGGNNMGLVLGWCHTTGMNQTAQYFDTARNSLMNAEAAR